MCVCVVSLINLLELLSCWELKINGINCFKTTSVKIVHVIVQESKLVWGLPTMLVSLCRGVFLLLDPNV